MRTMLSVILPKEMRKQLAVVCQLRGVTTSYVVRELIEGFLKKHEKTSAAQANKILKG